MMSVRRRHQATPCDERLRLLLQNNHFGAEQRKSKEHLKHLKHIKHIKPESIQANDKQNGKNIIRKNGTKHRNHDQVQSLKEKGTILKSPLETHEENLTTHKTHPIEPTKSTSNLDNFLAQCCEFNSTTYSIDQGIKLLQWTSWTIFYITKTAKTAKNAKATTFSTSSHLTTSPLHPLLPVHPLPLLLSPGQLSRISKSCYRLSEEINYARFTFRFFGFFESLEAFRTGSWAEAEESPWGPHRRSGKWDNPTIDFVARYILAGSMLVYYPLDHLNYFAWMVPDWMEEWMGMVGLGWLFESSVVSAVSAGSSASAGSAVSSASAASAVSAANAASVAGGEVNMVQGAGSRLAGKVGAGRVNKKTFGNLLFSYSSRFWFVYVIGEIWIGFLKWKELKKKLDELEDRLKKRKERLGNRKKNDDDETDDDGSGSGSDTGRTNNNKRRNKNKNISKSLTQQIKLKSKILNKIFEIKLQLLGSFLTLIPVVHWSQSDWNTNPLFHEGLVGLLMLAEAIVCIYISVFVESDDDEV